MTKQEEIREDHDELTGTELAVLDLLSKGLTNYAIANSLFISINTVVHHLNHIYSKLNIPENRHKRVMAMRYHLIAQGIIKEE